MFKQFTNLKPLIIQLLMIWTSVAAGLIAGWIQNEIFSNIFTPALVVGIIASVFVALLAIVRLQKEPPPATSNGPRPANTLPQSTSTPSKLTPVEWLSLGIGVFVFFAIFAAMFWLPWKIGMQGLERFNFSYNYSAQGALNRLSSPVLTGWEIITIWSPVKSSPSRVLLFIPPLILAFLEALRVLAIYLRSFKIARALSVLSVVLGVVVFVVLVFDLNGFNVIGLPLTPQELVAYGIQNGRGFYLCLAGGLLAMIGGSVQLIFGDRMGKMGN